MSDKPQNEYLKAKIMTARPDQLQTMLYDGAIRFCEQAREAVQNADAPTAHDRLMRAQRIVLELATSMKAELNPELCGKLAGLYNYVYRLLVDANLHKDLQKVDEALELLRYQRETWVLALEKLRLDRCGDAPPAPGAQKPTAASKPAGGAVKTGVGPGDPPGGRLCLEG